jgi:phosphotransferase system  glucose/maltose/N-acetylglucosamine-specific IIC component
MNLMKTSNHPQATNRASRFSKISQKHGLIVAVLVFASLFLGFVNLFMSYFLAVAAFAALIFSFISGYNRSDELEKLVQLKAAAVSFMVVMFLAFALSISSALNYKAPEDAISFIVIIGLVSHLVLLPIIAKRTYEK